MRKHLLGRNALNYVKNKILVFDLSCGGALVSRWLVRLSPDRVLRVLDLARDIVFSLRYRNWDELQPSGSSVMGHLARMQVPSKLSTRGQNVDTAL